MEINTNISSNEIHAEGADQNNLVEEAQFSESEIKTVEKYDEDSPTALSEKKAIDLFSSFTANIIKEETLFTR